MKLEQAILEYVATATADLSNSTYYNLLNQEIKQSTKQPFLPTLVDLVAQAANPNYDREKLQPLAISLHLSGFATVIFDDILDNDRAEALAKRVGSGQAFMVGLGIWHLAERKLLALLKEHATDEITALLDYTYQTYLRAFGGQYRELYGNEPISVKTNLEIVGLKSGLFLEMVFKLTASLAGATKAKIAQFGLLGHQFGVLFQLYNDLKSCFEPGERNSFYQKRPTLALAYAWESPALVSHQLKLLWQTDATPSADEINKMQELIRQAGGFLAALLTMQQIYCQIAKILTTTSPADAALLGIAANWLKLDKELSHDH